jgi:hypothetical protein
MPKFIHKKGVKHRFTGVQGYKGTTVQWYKGSGVRRCGGTEGGMGECGMGCTPQAPLPGGAGGGLIGLLRLCQPADPRNDSGL